MNFNQRSCRLVMRRAWAMASHDELAYVVIDDEHLSSDVPALLRELSDGGFIQLHDDDPFKVRVRNHASLPLVRGDYIVMAATWWAYWETPVKFSKIEAYTEPIVGFDLEESLFHLRDAGLLVRRDFNRWIIRGTKS